MKNILLSALLCSMAVITGCVTGGTPQKSALELQAFQRKQFDTTKSIAFASTVSVFQDLGYIIKTADIQSGLITASSPTQELLFFGSHMKNTEASAFIEEINPGKTYVRVNFVEAREDSGGYGMKTKSDHPIIDPKIYEGCFQKIQEAIFIRSHTQ